MLFRRYASPFLLLDEMIRTGELFEFVMYMVGQINEEQEWDFFLHKVFDKSFEEFKSEVKACVETQTVKMSESEIETTLKESRDILTNFIPEAEGGE